MSDSIQNINQNATFLDALLWQYSDKPNLTSLMTQKNTWYQENHIQFWKDWIANVFDIRTCDQFGLVVWGIILNIQLHATAPAATWTGLGFSGLNRNFYRSGFATIAPSTITLSIESQRIMLLLRYAQLTGKTSIPWINRMLKRILGHIGLIYVLDSLDMSYIYYVFTFKPSAELWFIFSTCNVLPKPACVGLKLFISGNVGFGFGSYNQNFYNSNFQNLLNSTFEVF